MLTTSFGLGFLSPVATVASGAVQWRQQDASADRVQDGMAVPGHGGTGILPNYAARGRNLIRLLAGAFDPLNDPAPAQSRIARISEATLAPGVAQYWLVQTNGNRYLQVGRAVIQAGGRIVGTIPDRVYIVRATPRQREAFAAHPDVRWTGYYQPAWRVPVAAGGRQGLMSLGGTRNYRVHVFRAEPNPGAVATALAAIPGVTIRENAGTVIDIAATSAQVPAIARIPAVEWVGIRPKVVPLNENARWVNDTGIRDVYAAISGVPADCRPGRGGCRVQIGSERLNGAGQTAGVADTAINYTYDLNGRAHVSFRDCDEDGTGCKEAIYTQAAPGSTTLNLTNVVDNDTDHRKMVAFFDLGNTGPNPFDASSHGSHTAGSVDGDQPPYGEYTGHDGLAPAAMHVHQNIGTASGGLSLPADDYQLWGQAYRPRKPASVPTTSPSTGNVIHYAEDCEDPPGATDPSTCYRPLEDARTHNNSYGLIAPVIDDGSAVALDQFVWDHEDMLIVVSAGNNGPDAGSIGSPSVAKNELSSGASANGRQPMVSIDSMASFSSHGPTGDGRYGVDVATPGQIVVSVKGGTVDEFHTAQGTSMSAPILTGLSTLVRQYFFDGYGPEGGHGFAVGDPNIEARRHNPSAALVKATLANGAVRMRGWYTADDGTSRAQDGQWPSAGQGFGRVNLDNSLFFEEDPTNNWYLDVYRGDTTTNGTCPAGSGPGGSECTSFAESGTAATRTFTMDVAEGQPLDVTLSYTDVPSPLVAGSPATINNLNLVVEGPTGLTYAGNNMNSRQFPMIADAETSSCIDPTPLKCTRDLKNLTERVRIAAPVPGTYTITVEADPILMGNGRQGFALAASGLISPVGGPAFEPGSGLQEDGPGSPEIEDVSVDPISSDTAKIHFTTDEPTTAIAHVDLDGNPVTPDIQFEDSYNEGADGYEGLGEGAVETNANHADRLVLGTSHEILLTGLGGTSRVARVVVDDLDDPANQTIRSVTITPPPGGFQADAPDIAQCGAASAGPPPSPDQGQWGTGTQMYAEDEVLLGAFMFRIPEAAIDPTQITGAAVEMVSAHDWVIPYTQDPAYTVDLLADAEETDWGLPVRNYTRMRASVATARAYPETAYRRGAYQRYPFAFRCGDLQALKDSLATVTDGERQAAFRYDSTNGGLFSMDFGFNRRSRGADLRPRLVLYGPGLGAPSPEAIPCDSSTPAPEISDVGIYRNGAAANSVTVSWRTDVAADSTVLFLDLGDRRRGELEWIQVHSAPLTRTHHVQVFGLDDANDYQFVVRSAACNGNDSTADNDGEGWHFFHPPLPPPPPTDDWFFHGGASDEANKVAAFTADDYTLATATFSQGAPDGSLGTQKSAGGNQEFVGNFLGAWWYNPNFTTPIDAEVPVRLYVATTDPLGVALGADVVVDFYANPTGFGLGQGVLIGRRTFPMTGLSPVPSLQTITVPVDSTGVTMTSMLVQVIGAFQDNPELEIHYDTTQFPSNFGIPTGPPPPPPPGGPLPLTGPVPPPSAGGLIEGPPDTRLGPATANEIAAGTGPCVVGSDISVTKTASVATADTGTEVEYTIEVTNAGPDPALEVTLTDSLPAGTTVLVSPTGEGTCELSCGIGSVQPGETVTISTVLGMTTAGSKENTATVTAENEQGPADDNTASATVVVSGLACATGALLGTAEDDTLIGTAASEVICGFRGDDVLIGNGGNDFLIAGPGNDALSGDAAPGGRRVVGPVDIDRLAPGTGNDIVDGGGGSGPARIGDTVTYFDIRGTDGVTVDLSLAAAQNTGPGGSDTISLVESATGSRQNDVIRGNGGTNYLTGGPGNDQLFGMGGNDVLVGSQGTDTLDGGADIDTASYKASAGASNVNLTSGVVSSDGVGGSDTLVVIEAVSGSNTGGDTLVGSATRDFLYGQGANDNLSGNAGDDYLHGGPGTDDTIDGGFGNDTCVQGENVTTCEGGARRTVYPWMYPDARSFLRALNLALLR